MEYPHPTFEVLMGCMDVVDSREGGGVGFEYVPGLDDVGHAGKGIALLPEVGGQSLMVSVSHRVRHIVIWA